MTEIKVVIDANYGDSGKGLMTDYFCHKAMQKSNKCLVVCSNGGAQRGHTVETPEGIRHVFHHFGSGTLVGADTYLPDKFILNPMIFRKEYEELEKLGFIPKVYVNGKCIITTPYDMILNQYLEFERGDNKHGSCGCGIWETIVRNGEHNNTKIAFNVDSVLTSSSYIENPKQYLNGILSLIRNFFFYHRVRDEITSYKNATLDKINERLKEYQWYDLIYSETLMDNYIDDFLFMMSKVDIVEDNILKNYDHIVFENGQGLLLDENRKGNHITPSSTGLRNPITLINKVYSEEEQLKEIKFEACYVSRTYMTRHGAGSLEHECEMDDIGFLVEPDLTNITNPYQGKLRYAYLDTCDLDTRTDDDYHAYKNKFYSKTKTCAATHVNETNCRFKTPAGNNATDIIEYYVSDGKTRESVMLNKEFRVKYGV